MTSTTPRLYIYIFFLYIFRGFCVYGVPMPTLRCQHTVLCHPRWLPTSGLTEFAMCWGRAGFEPRTTDLQSGALPLSHLSSWLYIYIAPLFQTLCERNSTFWPLNIAASMSIDHRCWSAGVTHHSNLVRRSIYTLNDCRSHSSGFLFRSWLSSDSADA